jgi:hypothetical protein
MKRDLQRVQRAAARAQQARQARDELIRELHPRYTVRAIAEAAGLSPARVGQIVKQASEEGKP